MDNLNAPLRRRFSQVKKGQDLFKVSDNLLTSLEDFSNSNRQLPEQGKDFYLLSGYYNKKSGNGNFLDKIGKLNKKFYTASDKYINSKKILEKLNDDLYLNLFQQINCYVEEIERLNKKLLDNNNQELKKTIAQLNKDIIEKKEKIRNYEIKIKEKTTNEEKLKKDIESYKRRIIFYKDKINIGLLGRNRHNLIGRETVANGEEKKRNNKNHDSPTGIKKTRSFYMKNNYKNHLTLKLDEDNIINNKAESNKNVVFNDSDERYKKNKKKFNLRESIYDTKTNLINRTDYDIDGKEEDIKADFKQELIKVNNTSNQKKFKSEFFKILSKELYDTHGSDNNSKNNITENKNDDYINPYTSLDLVGIEENDENENEEKSIALNKRNNKGRSMTNKVSNNANFPIKSKFKSQKKINNFMTNKNDSKSNYSSKTQTENNNSTNKSNQTKNNTKSKSKKSSKTSNISDFSEVHTPYTKKKFDAKLVKEKEKLIPNSNKSQSSTGSAYNLKNNMNASSSKKKDSIYLKNKFSEQRRDVKPNHSMSNLNIVNRREKNISSNMFGNKKFNGKENNKELISIIKDVNDDYLNSIEMLRRQEEQIKYMLRFIDLDEK